MTQIKDRFQFDQKNSVDVVIPILHASDDFKRYLETIYADVPINRLLIGNAGMSSELLEMVNSFPRVLIVDHTHTKSLGYSLQLLFSIVETEWFVYFHSDVSVPEGWFDEMSSYKKNFDWFECKQIDPVGNVQEAMDMEYKSTRAYSGSQMGRSIIFQNIRKVDDDYIWRGEDIFFQQEIEKQGFQYGKVSSTYHNHHVRENPTYDKFLDVNNNKLFLKELIKYFSPEINYNQYRLIKLVNRLILLPDWSGDYWISFASDLNPQWIPVLNKILKNHKRILLIRSILVKFGLGENFKVKFLSKLFFRL